MSKYSKHAEIGTCSSYVKLKSAAVCS